MRKTTGEQFLIEAATPDEWSMVERVRVKFPIWFEQGGLVGYADVYKRVCTHLSMKRYEAKKLIFELARRHPDEFEVHTHGIELKEKNRGDSYG